MTVSMRRRKVLQALVAALVQPPFCAALPAPDSAGTAAAPPLAREFSQEVRPLLHPSRDAAAAYAATLSASLAAAGVQLEVTQFVVLVDRSPRVQALLVFWGSTNTGWAWVGATSVSTGRPGRFEHFQTPLGVFDHSATNPDYRAEGTKNEFGIRGYGLKGSRVYDFGWVRAPKGWGDGATSVMRLQMHSTDPDLLEARLGTAQSKGCVRIPATLNEFFDRRGLLDADYQEEIANGASPWVLRTHRELTDWPGRYLVVVDSRAAVRPTWAVARPQPAAPRARH
jgi:hypothetical protein